MSFLSEFNLEAENLALEAKTRGKWVHVGRVSAISTARLYWPWADSYDGTTFKYNPNEKEESYIPQMEKFFNRNIDIIQEKMF